MAEIVLAAHAVTVEYDHVHGSDACVIVSFPDADKKVTIVGTVEQQRGVVDTWSKMLDDLEEGD